MPGGGALGKTGWLVHAWVLMGNHHHLLAWWLRRYTILDWNWIAERLSMGHENRVTLAVREVERTTYGAMAKQKKLLEKLALELKQPKDG